MYDKALYCLSFAVLTVKNNLVVIAYMVFVSCCDFCLEGHGFNLVAALSMRPDHILSKQSE